MGGDRADMALAALETSTSALILTGIVSECQGNFRATERGASDSGPQILYTIEIFEVSRRIRPGDSRGSPLP